MDIDSSWGKKNVAKFLVRILMHGGDVDDYSDLLTELRTHGFTHAIADINGVTYRLPWGEFACETQGSPTEVLDQANACVAALGFQAEMVVVEYTVAATRGLPVARGNPIQR